MISYKYIELELEKGEFSWCENFDVIVIHFLF